MRQLILVHSIYPEQERRQLPVQESIDLAAFIKDVLNV